MVQGLDIDFKAVVFDVALTARGLWQFHVKTICRNLIGR